MSIVYARPKNVADAIDLVSRDSEASYLAGGTTFLDLLLKDSVIAAQRVVDITRLPLRDISHTADSIRVGALVTMEELATAPLIAEKLPSVRDALLASASVQLRNMATIGGNLLQRTRCRYFRDGAITECNKRIPGSGCAAVRGPARMHAILGADENCIALHGSDLCIALVALDARVHIEGAHGKRILPLKDLYILAKDQPHRETILQHGELITTLEIPFLPSGARSTYLKVRDRASYEFALVSAAAAMVIENGTIAWARLALGGVGTVPWRAPEAEAVLQGAPAHTETYRTAAQAALHGAFRLPGTAFKIDLAQRTIIRTLQSISDAER